MDSSRRWVLLTCLLAALAFLAATYALAGLWWAATALPSLVALWWLLKGPGSRWLPSALLVIYVVEAAAGILAGASSVLPIAGTGLMLVSWELARPYQRSASPAASPETGVSAPTNLKLLIISVGGGVLAAEAGQFIRLPIPFGVLLLAGLLVLLSLWRFYQPFDR